MVVNATRRIMRAFLSMHDNVIHYPSAATRRLQRSGLKLPVALPGGMDLSLWMGLLFRWQINQVFTARHILTGSQTIH
ncbi:hypothetical protein B0H34DRAFT_822198 [Crassisporium funariophilum]|nr:hypothetical protein B0H34DRAFT_822198 [Crassisporium funariophilum]